MQTITLGGLTLDASPWRLNSIDFGCPNKALPCPVCSGRLAIADAGVNAPSKSKGVF